MAAARVASATSPTDFVVQLGPLLTDRSRGVRSAATLQLVGVPRDLLTRRQRDAIEPVLDDYRQGQLEFSDRAACHNNLAALAARLGDMEEAVGELRTAIRLEPYLTGPRSDLASTLEGMNGDQAEIRRLRTEELSLLQRDLELLPDNPAIAYRLGLMHYLVGSLNSAQRALSKAADLAPHIFDYQMALALIEERLYDQSGDPANFNAVDDALKKMEQLRPTDPQADQIRQRIQARRNTKVNADSDDKGHPQSQ
jgi:tetratricopeptide (TPR) repeat protein